MSDIVRFCGKYRSAGNFQFSTELMKLNKQITCIDYTQIGRAAAVFAVALCAHKFAFAATPPFAPHRFSIRMLIYNFYCGPGEK